MKKIFVLLIIVGVGVVMLLTKPDKKAHKEAMMKAVTEYVDEEAEKHGLGDGLLSELGKGLVRSVAGAAIDLKLREDDYYLFNTTHVRLDGKDKTLSLGVLGHVFTFDKDMLREALEKGDKAEQKDSDEKEEESF